MRQRKKFRTALRRFSRNESSSGEKFLFAVWLAKLDITGGAGVFNTKQEEEATETRMRDNLYRINVAHTGVGKPVVRRVRYLVPMAVAAALLALLAGVWYFPERETTALAKQLKEVKAAPGTFKNLKLADGSKIRLKASGSLKVVSPFNDTLREVFLSGEAYFEIARDESRPFVVRSENLDIRILGTSFNVRHEEGGAETEVLVTTGKVLVTENKPGGLQWILLPGNKLVYNARKSGASQAIAEVKTLIPQSADTLVFENETLEYICKSLEQRYGATIRIQASSLKLKRLTLKQKDESLAQVMEMLSTAAGFSYSIQGSKVNITKAN